jgi:predicted nucleic acid-binding protein
MKDRAFFDTNILIYLYSSDDVLKQSIAEKATDDFDCITSIQVLSEFSNICIKKLKMPADIVADAISEIEQYFEIEIPNIETIKQSLQIHNRYKYSYYDCLIIASALKSSSKYLFSEDMYHTQTIDNSLEIVNIFKKNIIIKT